MVLTTQSTLYMLNKYQWDKLNNQQTGSYAEYFVKMEFTMFGFQVYTTEVDDRGIDFVCKYEKGSYIEVQVKSIRDFNYVFMRKDHFQPHEYLYLALVILLQDKEPELYLIPSKSWLNPNTLFVSRDYINKKSKPEWGLNISRKNMPVLENFIFNITVQKLINKNI